jgi:hypothetical protein
MHTSTNHLLYPASPTNPQQKKHTTISAAPIAPTRPVAPHPIPCHSLTIPLGRRPTGPDPRTSARPATQPGHTRTHEVRSQAYLTVSAPKLMLMLTFTLLYYLSAPTQLGRGPSATTSGGAVAANAAKQETKPGAASKKSDAKKKKRDKVKR